MGIALPPWVVEAHNNAWVLGAYGILFGIGLPFIVVCVHIFAKDASRFETFRAPQGKWWFGSRSKTKDGVFSQTATSFWKSLTETSDVFEVISAIGSAEEWQTMASGRSAPSDILRTLEKAVEAELGFRWVHIRKQFQRAAGELDARWVSLILLYAHFLRLPIGDPVLRKCALFPKLTLLIYIQSVHRPRGRSPANPKPSQRPSYDHDCPQLVTTYYRNYAPACVPGARHHTRFGRRKMGTVARS